MSQETEKSLIGSIANYSFSKIYVTALGVLGVFVRPKLLTPQLYGLWNLLNMVPTYSTYAHLGARDSMRYLIPYYGAQGDDAKVNDISGTVFHGSFYVNAVVSLVLVLLAFKTGLRTDERVGVAVMAVLVLLAWYFEYYLTLLKSHQQFRLITHLNYMKATMNLGFGVVLIYYFQIYGAYLTALLSVTLLIPWVRWRFRPGSFGRFRLKTFVQLVKVGFPIMIWEVLCSLINTSGRLVVVGFLGQQQLGYYAISTMVLGALMKVPGAAIEIMEPRLMAELNVNNDKANLDRYFLRPLLNTAYYMPVAVGSIILLFPSFVEWALPKYLPGVRATQIVTAGAYFYAMLFVCRGIIVAKSWQTSAAYIIGVLVLFNIALSAVLVKLGAGITGVAWCTSLSMFGSLFGTMLFLFHRLRLPRKVAFGYLKAVAAPILVMISTLWILYVVRPFVPLHEYLYVAVELLAYNLVTFGMIWFVSTKLQIIDRLDVRLMLRGTFNI